MVPSDRSPPCARWSRARRARGRELRAARRDTRTGASPPP